MLFVFVLINFKILYGIFCLLLFIVFKFKLLFLKVNGNIFVFVIDLIILLNVII